MKKILFVITKSNWGGAQRYVYDLAVNLPKDQFEVTVALGGDGELQKKLSSAGVRVIQIAGLQRDVSLIQEIRAARALTGIVKREQPDVLHLNSSKAGFIGVVVGRWCHVPRIVFTSHGWAFNEDRNWLSKALFYLFHYLTVLTSHRTIAVSQAVKQQLRGPGMQKKMIVIHNGSEPASHLTREVARAHITTIVPKLRQYQNDFWTVTIGELHKTKRHDRVIKAIAALKDRGIIIRHCIISTGSEREYLVNLVTSLDLRDQVFLLGHIDEAARYLKAFDLFVLASRSEALGYVILEAAQAELPIVATNVGGIPEIVSDGREALLVLRDDQAALTDALQILYTDRDKAALIATAAKVKSAIFSIKTMVDTTAIQYRS